MNDEQLALQELARLIAVSILEMPIDYNILQQLDQNQVENEPNDVHPRT